MDFSKNLENIRKILKQEHLEGVIVPYGDEFRNEFLPSFSQRLRYITGFEGSAGLAIISLKAAGLFVDGRYITAAKAEVDSGFLKPYLWTEENIREFLEEHFKKGDTLGVDPWTITSLEWERFKALGDFCGLFLKKLSFNPVDKIWKERPLFSVSKAFLHKDSYAGESTSSKRSRMANILKENGAHALYIGLPESLNWLLNVRGEDVPFTPLLLATGILYDTGKVEVFTDLRKIPPFFYEDFSPHVQFLDRVCLEKSLEDLVAKSHKIWCDPASVPDAVLSLLKKGSGQLLKKADPCLLEKSIKNSCQIKGMRKSHVRDAGAVVRFLCWLDHQKGPLCEKEAAQRLDRFRKDLPLYHTLSFETISAFGAHAARPHHRPREGDFFSRGTVYLVDSGGQYLDGTTDITRTVLWGRRPFLKDIKDAFTRVLKGHIALASIKFPKGTTGHQLDVLARQFLWEKGLDFSHGTGHGVGSFLSVHEGPQSISKRASAVELLPGMILSNEPGYYAEDAFGIRIENLVVVRTSSHQDFYRFETLTLVPIDKKLMKKSLLTQAEKAWINAYHAKVLKTLSPSLNSQEIKWLKKATLPL